MKSFPQTALAAIFAAAITLGVSLALQLSFGRALEDWMGDKMQLWRYQLLGRLEPARRPDARLVLASIDQTSVSALGRWPFPRGVHGQFLGVLAAAKPKVVAWDILFTEYTAMPPPLTADDQLLVQGAQIISCMISGASSENSSGLTLAHDETGPTKPLTRIHGDTNALPSSPFAIVPFPELRQVSAFGFVDADGEILRRLIPLVVSINGKIFPSLDLQTLMQFWDVPADAVEVDLGRAITLPRHEGGPVRIPIDEQGRLLVNYRARFSDFQMMSYSDMGRGLSDLYNGKPSGFRQALPPLQGNILVVGSTLSGTDESPTPIDPYSPLVAAHLNVLNNVLQGDYLSAANPWIWLPLYFVYLFAIAHLMLRVGFSLMVPIGLLALVAGVVAAFAMLGLGNVLMPVMVPEIGILMLAAAVPTQRFFGEEREKRRVKSAMSAYLSDKVMNKILAHPDNLKLGGEKVEITVMFCDIRGFTAYCDERDPAETMDVLNDYMEAMTQVVFRHEGTIDKYIGDCIMAFWNAPEPQAGHADLAVKCAMEMRAALAEFKRARRGGAIDQFECGIGIHTGEALVGNMGSSLKRNYTAMGSTVNLGARLESLTKKMGERILISHDTRVRLQGEFPLVDRGEAEVAGVARPVHVYAVRTEAEIGDAGAPETAQAGATTGQPS